MLLALDKFGRMVLPKAIREDFGLVPGDRLEATEQGDCIVLRPVREHAVVKSKEGVLVFSGVASGNVAGAVSAAREDRLDSFSALGRGR